MTSENPFLWREYDGLVFYSTSDRNFYIGRLSRREREEWQRIGRCRPREVALRDLQARTKNNVQAEPTKPSSTTSATEVPTSGESDGPLPMLDKDKRQPDKPATNTAPLTIANCDTTASARDEIVIGERRFISERRIAAMLGYSLRTLQRWRTEGKSPPTTNIGRKPYYELDGLQEWIDREKAGDFDRRLLAGRTAQDPHS